MAHRGLALGDAEAVADLLELLSLNQQLLIQIPGIIDGIIANPNRFELLRTSVTSAVPITASSPETEHSLQIVNLPESLGSAACSQRGFEGCSRKLYLLS